MAKQNDGSGRNRQRRGAEGLPPGEGNDPVGRAIGTRLKSLYDEVAQEPVPERFLTLLDRLAAEDDGSTAAAGKERA